MTSLTRLNSRYLTAQLMYEFAAEDELAGHHEAGHLHKLLADTLLESPTDLEREVWLAILPTILEFSQDFQSALRWARTEYGVGLESLYVTPYSYALAEAILDIDRYVSELRMPL